MYYNVMQFMWYPEGMSTTWHRDIVTEQSIHQTITDFGSWFLLERGTLRDLPTMPTLARKPSYIQFTPKRAMASFENLVALANYEERLKEARKIVWRDRGELPVEVADLWECFEHARRGGFRAHLFWYAQWATLTRYFCRFRSVGLLNPFRD